MNISLFLCALLLGCSVVPVFADEYFHPWALRSLQGPIYEVQSVDVDSAAIEVIQRDGKVAGIFLHVTFTSKASLRWASFLLDYGIKPFTVKVGEESWAGDQPVEQGDTIILKGRSIHLACSFDVAAKLLHGLIPGS